MDAGAHHARPDLERLHHFAGDIELEPLVLPLFLESSQARQLAVDVGGAQQLLAPYAAGALHLQRKLADGAVLGRWR